MTDTPPKGSTSSRPPPGSTSSRPPPGSTSSRPPPGSATLDRGRLTTALAAGGAVLLLSGTAVVLWPRTYGAEATFVVDGGARVANPVALASRIEAALLERDQLAVVAMELPLEQRSPDPIGRLRGGIRVLSRGALGYAVEFRGSDPASVQNVTNRLAERAVALVPVLASMGDDTTVLKDLGQRSRAVTEFLSAHPEITIDPSGERPTATDTDRALDVLRSEKRNLELRLAEKPSDNPYDDRGEELPLMHRRLVELKDTISAREAALKRQSTEGRPVVSPELQSHWRSLLSGLSEAQAKAAQQAPVPAVTAHVTAKATRPTSPLTPNRAVLSIVAALLSLAAGMLAYVLPGRVATPTARRPRGASEHRRIPSPQPPAAATTRSDPPPGAPLPPPPGSDPPGPMAPRRPVVLSSSPPPPAATGTVPTGLAAPAPPPKGIGSKPPPGAGSYSVSSSHPPPPEGGGAPPRTSIERLSPLQSAHPPPAGQATGETAQQIMSRPPALDPDAERWAARFESPPPPAAAPPPTTPPPESPPPERRAGRWKTQVMGSMVVPLDVVAARDQEPEDSAGAEPPVTRALTRSEPPQRQAPPQAVRHQDVPYGWRPSLDGSGPNVTSLRDSVLGHGLSNGLSVVVSGPPGSKGGKARIAAGLALALAQAGARVLLVEADFDHPELHQALDVAAPANAGFSQQLNARAQRHPLAPWTIMRCSPNLHLLAEGRLRSPGLLLSGAFENAILELRPQYQVLIISGPPTTTPTELLALDHLAQAAIMANGEQPASIHFGQHSLRQLAT